MAIFRVVVAAFLATAIVGAARSQDNLAKEVAALVKETKALQAKAPKLKSEADQFVARNERLLKEYKLYDKQKKERLWPAYRKIKKDQDKWNEARQRYVTAASRYSARCRGRLPQPEHQRCMREISRLNTWADRLTASHTRIGRRLASYLKDRAQYNKRMDEISAEIKSNFKTWREKTGTLRTIHTKLRSYAARLNRACAAAMRRTDPNAAEAIKHCHSVRWDGARVNLPELQR